MKVSVADFKNAVLMFEGALIDGASSVTNKSALAMAFTKFAPQINDAIASLVKDGMVDVDAIKELMDAGIKGGGGKIVLMPKFPDWVSLLGVTIKDITITAAEAEEFFTKTIPQVSKTVME